MHVCICLVLILRLASALRSVAFFRDACPSARFCSPSDDKEEVLRKEAEFQAMLDDMLTESREIIAKNGINMGSTEAMLNALEETKKLNLTEEDEQKAVDEFSASLADFVDSMVKIDDGNGGEELSMLEQFAITNDAGDTVDVGPIHNLSLDDSLKIVKNLNMSQQDYDETVGLLQEVDPSERSDIIDFMLRARSRGQD